MTIDAWNPQTFADEIATVLTEYSRLILDYYVENRKLMDEHLNRSTYQSLKPNPHSRAFQEFHENVLAPTVARSRIRAWHYTRLTDDEADAMSRKLVPSSLKHLRYRLNNLVANNLLTHDDADTVFAHSPYHKQSVRAGCICTTIIPLSHYDSGVEPLLESWGGESAYFWLTDEGVAKKLRTLGTPRIIEIETALADNLNGYKVAKTFLDAWAKKLGAPTAISGCDLFIKESIGTAKVLRIHSDGGNSFEAVGTVYPEGIAALVNGGH